jgi:hypothetical protein
MTLQCLFPLVCWVLIRYARIKGIPESQVAEAAAAKMEEMDLTQYADKLAGGYRCVQPLLTGATLLYLQASLFIYCR